MNNKAFIPLYLNSKIIENLFTIVIEEFSQSETKTVKEQVVLNIDTPLSEIIQGRYIQGDLSLKVANEFSTAATEERRVKIISIFINLMNILKKNNLLKEVHSKNIVDSIVPGDFIIFSCELIEDPIISCFKDLEYSNKFSKYDSMNASISGEVEEDNSMGVAKEFL